MKHILILLQIINIFLTMPAVAEQRLALVIGNAAYPTEPLQNPANDARDLAQVLSKLGFEVIHRENLSQNDMKKSIRTFGKKLQGGGVGLFYYAGHGVQVDGKNYLIPVNAAVNSEREVEYESVDVGFVLAQMEAARNPLNIVILDACRNNPFSRSFRSSTRGLASIDAPAGTLIAYATAPGSVASDGNAGNGLYTQELLANMRQPELKIEEVFKRVRIGVQQKTAGKQVPWESSSLTGDFYFITEKNRDKLAQLPPLKPIAQTAPQEATRQKLQQSAEDISGNWLAEVKYDWGNNYTEKFKFIMQDQEIHGAASFLGRDRGLLKGKLNGNKLTFITKTQEVTDDWSNPKTQIHRYSGILTGDVIKFILQTEGGMSEHTPVEFTARRAGQ